MKRSWIVKPQGIPSLQGRPPAPLRRAQQQSSEQKQIKLCRNLGHKCPCLIVGKNLKWSGEGEDGAAAAMAEAGGEDGEEDGEDHDGEAHHHATDSTLPSVRQQRLLEIFVRI